MVAGEASGDRAAASVLAELKGVRAFGMGGLALAGAGAELTFDLRSLTALGIGDVVARAGPVAQAYRAVTAATKVHRPRAALLVNYSEFNLRLAAKLKKRGTKVLFYIAPQIWAWRPSRAEALRESVDKLAVILPFEESLWRSHGVDATYVGHPLTETFAQDRSTARRLLDLTPSAPAVAMMPGSRPHECERHLKPMLAAYEKIRRERASLDARVLLAPSLAGPARAEVLELARRARVPVYPIAPDGTAREILSAFDVSLCASGTASLEAAFAGALPVIVYRTGLVTEGIARLLMQTPYVGLPNVLLARAAFPELLQREVTPHNVARAMTELLDRPAVPAAAAAEIRALFAGQHRPSHEVAAMLRELLR